MPRLKDDVILYYRLLGIGEKFPDHLMDFIGTSNSMKWKSHLPGTVRIDTIGGGWNSDHSAMEVVTMIRHFDGLPVRKYIDFNAFDWGKVRPIPIYLEN